MEGSLKGSLEQSFYFKQFCFFIVNYYSMLIASICCRSCNVGLVLFLNVLIICNEAIQSFFLQWVEAMQRFQEAAELIDAENRMKKTMWGQFWSSHQRFFKYLCIAAKVKHAVQTAR